MNYRNHADTVQRVREHGAATLSDVEALAVLVGSIEGGAALLDAFGSVRRILTADPAHLETVAGIGPAISARLAAARELWSRASSELSDVAPLIQSPEDVHALLGPTLSHQLQESVVAILLDHRKRLIRWREIFRGTGNESFANPAEILRMALVHSARGIILAHNHPSGDPGPSRADHEATRRLRDACGTVGIDFVDHVIIGRKGFGHESYFSFREAGLV